MLKSGKANFWINLSIVLGTVSLWNLTKFVPVQAQITPDRTLPTEVSSPDNLNYTIDGGATAGSNLFHSFEEFSVPTNGQAFFNNATDIVNIFSRVTGGNLSNIDGLLRANGTANLFLINPAGIIFGQNASLNIGGSFFGTTANSLLFPDGLEFNANVGSNSDSGASTGASPLLSVNVPIGLQTGVNPGNIVNRSLAVDSNGNSVGLQVGTGQKLALVGGNLLLEGGILNAEQGRIELGSIGGETFVGINADNFALNYQDVESFQDIQLSNRAIVSASGPGGGEIQVQGRQISLTGGSQIEANTLGGEMGGSLVVSASESVEIRDRLADGTPSALQTRVESTATGTGGNLTVTAPRLRIAGGARVAASSLTQTGFLGDGGNLTIRASESLEVTGVGQFADGTTAPSQVSTVTTGPGNGGNILIETGQLIAQDGGQVTSETFGAVNAGLVTVNAAIAELTGRSADDTEPSGLLTRAKQGATGQAGDLTMTVGRLTVQGGARVTASSLGEGNAGNLTIDASDRIEVIGAIALADGSPNTNNPAQISVLTTGSGEGGDILIETDQLIAQGGGQVTSETYGAGNAGLLTVNAAIAELTGRSADDTKPSGLLTRANQGATGQAGDLTMTVGRLTVQGGARVTASSLGSGNAGNLTIQASDRVEVIGAIALPDGSPNTNNPAQISVLTTGSGEGGNILINTDQLIAQGGGQVTSETYGAGNAGLLTVNAAIAELTGRSADDTKPSGLLTRVNQGATGQAGDLTLTVGQLTVQGGARVTTSSLGSGNAGNLTIHASDRVEVIGAIALPDGSPNTNNPSQISALTTGEGKAGNLTVMTPRLTTSEGGQVVASTFSGGDAGELEVTADRISLIGRSADNTRPSGLLARVEVEAATGNASTITVVSDRLQVADGARLAAASRGQGNAGDVIVQGSELIEVTGGGEISVRGLSTGQPGNLTTQGIPGVGNANIRLDNQGSLAASSETGKGGSITLTGRDIYLFGQSQILARGSQRGNPTLEGNANIQADILLLLDRSLLGTDANNPQGGSNVRVDALTTFVSPDSTIVAAGELILTTQLEVSEVIQQPALPDITGLIAGGCRDYKGSTFIVTGRGGKAASPEDLLIPDAVVAIDWVELPDVELATELNVRDRNFSQSEMFELERIVEATGYRIGPNGQIILTANRGTFNRDRSAMPPLCPTG